MFRRTQLGLTTLGLVLSFLSTAKADLEPKAIGESAPSLQLSSWVNGEAFSLEGKRGSCVVLLFWGSYYKEFHPYLADLNEFASLMEPKGVSFLGISTETVSQLKENAASFGVQFPLAIDSSTALFSQYGVTRIPYAFVIDPEGKIAWSGMPYEANGFHNAVSSIVDDPRFAFRNSLRKQIDEALQKEQNQEFSFAYQAWKAIGEKGKKESDIAQEVSNALTRIESLALAEIESAQKQIQGADPVGGVGAMEQALKKYKGTRAVSSAEPEFLRYKQSPRFLKEREAKGLLDRAKTALDKKDFASAAEALLLIEQKMKETVVFELAKLQLEELRSEGRLWAEIAQKLSEKEIRSLVNLADSARRAGREDLAREYLSKAEGLKAQIEREKEKSLVLKK